jgi:hypothetical protein
MLTNRIHKNRLSFLVLSFLQELKDEVDSASGDIHLNEDDSSSGSGSEHSCPPAPVDSHTDVSHSESKVLRSVFQPLWMCLHIYGDPVHLSFCQ